jgi:hypothetical protein
LPTIAVAVIFLSGSVDVNTNHRGIDLLCLSNHEARPDGRDEREEPRRENQANENPPGRPAYGQLLA